MNFDLRTMYWAFSISDIVMAVALVLTFAGQMRRGLALWTASLVVQAVAWLLFGVRGLAPDALGFFASNGLLTLSLSLQAAALLRFERREAPAWLLWAPFAVAVTVMAPLLPYVDLRFTVVNVLHGVVTGAVAILMLKLGVGRGLRSRYLVMGGYTVGCVLFFIRGTLSVITPEQVSSSLEPSGVHWALHLLAQAPILFIAIGYLVMHKESADAQLRELATIDPLTGAFNRRAFFDLAERELAMAARNASPLTVMMLDLDHFKRVNDTHGHRAGDAVLRQFARRTLELLRKGDALVRYGGEEFCVLLPHTDAPGAVALAERIRDTIEQNAVDHETTSIGVTVSIGLCTLPAGAPGDLQNLIDRADAALYEAKAGGRNRVASASHIVIGPAA